MPSHFLVDIVLLLLPITACALLAVRCGVSHWLLLMTSAVAGSGVLALVTFWAYLAGPRFGRGVAIALALASALVLLEACRHRFAAWKALRPLLPVSALFAASGFFNVATAYLHQSFATQPNPGMNRYRIALPSDNNIAWFFAKQLEAKARPLPEYVVPGWQSSDRPPLQTGYYLMQHAVLNTSNYNDYLITSIVLQGCWILGLWALLRAMGKGRWAVAACLFAAMFNGFVLQNTVFTWPKLIAAAGILLAAAIVCTRQFPALRRSRAAGALTGAAAGAGMMGHPGSVFALGGLALVIAALWLLPRLRPGWWQPPTWRFLWPAGALFALCYGPWSLYYTQIYQPPGNALSQVQLANTIAPGQSTLKTVVNAYKQAGLHTTVTDKISNLKTPFRGTFSYLHWMLATVYHELTGHDAAAAKAAHHIVTAQFYYLGAILGIVGWGLLILLVRAGRDLVRRIRAPKGLTLARGGADYSQEYLLLAVISIYSLVWAIALFGPKATAAHQGTYFTEPVLLALGVLGFWSISRYLGMALALISGFFTLWVYVAFTPVTTLRTNLIGGYNDSLATGPASTYLALGILACLLAAWWVGADRFGYAATLPSQPTRSDVEAREAASGPAAEPEPAPSVAEVA
jgi:hypothetical protein